MSPNRMWRFLTRAEVEYIVETLCYGHLALMKITPTAIPDVVMIEPRIFQDERGLFFESFNTRDLAAHGITGPFVQDNHSISARNVVRGLHYQLRHPQGKLVRV